MTNIFEGYEERYPDLVGLKKDAEFNEQANSAIITFLTENKTTEGSGFIQLLAKDIRENAKAVEEQLATEWEKSTGSMEDFGEVIDGNTAKINAIATLMSLSELYVLEAEYRGMTKPNGDTRFPDKFAIQMRDHQRRIEQLETFFKEDVRRLYRVYADDSGASAICGDILRIVHFKRGQIDPTEMFRLDYDNKAAALRVIELLASPSELSDDGLSGILSSGQLDRLLSE